MKRMLGLLLVGCLCLSVAPIDAQSKAPSGSRPTQPPNRGGYVVPPGYDRNHIQVKFLDDLDIGMVSSSSWPVGRSGNLLRSPEAQGLFQKIFAAGGVWSRLAGSDEATMDKLRANAQKNLGKHVADMNTYFVLRVPPGLRAEELVDAFQKLPEVEFASAMPLHMPPTSLPPDNYQPLQGYLNKATDGIGASYTWPRPGGTGTNVTIVDMEYSWTFSHADLPSPITVYVPPNKTWSDPWGHYNHGTAVLGVLASVNNVPNPWGTTGIAHGATIGVAPIYVSQRVQIANQISYVTGLLDPGDVLLIEVAIYGPHSSGSGSLGTVPVEWDRPIYDAIVTAVGNGIHVVEGGGNGYENLDDPIYSQQHGNHWPFLAVNNSGAIIVGAGFSPGMGNCSVTTYMSCVSSAGCPGGEVCLQHDRSRMDFSNYGSRFDLQGWGENVVTTGYGNLFDDEGPNYYYEGGFGGTSSGSAMVAGAVALYSSVLEAESAPPAMRTPASLRTKLVSTGSAQQSGANSVCQHIGPRPNLRAALEVSASYEWPTFHNNNERLGEAVSTFTTPLIEQWKYTISSNSNNYGPVLSGGKLFTGTNDGRLRAFDAYSPGDPPAPLWTRTLGLSGYGHAIPAVVGDTLYTTYIFPYPLVYALNVNDGTTRWSMGQPSDPVHPALWQTTAVANGRLYVGTSDNRVTAINLNTTDHLPAWTSQPYARVVAGAAVSDGKVVFGTDDSRVIALNELDGTLVWSRTVDDAVIMVPLIARGNVYVSSRSGITYAFKASNGNDAWPQPSANVGPIFYSTPAYDGEKLYYGSQNYGFIALRADTGETVWERQTVFPSQSSVAYANGYVFGTTVSSTLVVLDASDGTIVNTVPFAPFSNGSSSPAVFNGWVWAEDGTGTVYGFKGTLLNSDGDIDSDGNDCAPWNANINHGAQEVCDGVDNDCDGLVDEDIQGGCSFCP